MSHNEDTLFALLPEHLRRIQRAIQVVNELGGYGKIEINLKKGIVDGEYGIFIHPAVREPVIRQEIEITTLHKVIKEPRGM